MLLSPLPAALLAHAGHPHDLGRHVPVPVLVGLAVVIGGLLPARARNGVTAAVVLCSAAAGTIHAVVTPDHFEETVVFGLFFLAVTVWQLAVVVVALHRPSRALWTSTTIGTIAVLGIWAMSRTTGIPIGPDPWTPEPTGLLDLACAAYEGAIVVGCLWLRRAAADPAPDPFDGLSGRAASALSPVTLPAAMSAPAARG